MVSFRREALPIGIFVLRGQRLRLHHNPVVDVSHPDLGTGVTFGTADFILRTQRTFFILPGVVI